MRSTTTAVIFAGFTVATSAYAAQSVREVTTPAIRFIGMPAENGATPPASSDNVPLGQKRSGPHAPNAATPTVILHIPYSFENPRPKLKRAVIRCTLYLGINSAPKTSEQVVIVVRGQSLSGTADVEFVPTQAGGDYHETHAYGCMLTVGSDNGGGYPVVGKWQPWMQPMPGSVVTIRGMLG